MQPPAFLHREHPATGPGKCYSVSVATAMRLRLYGSVCIRVQQYIDQVGPERYAIECLVAHMTDVELKRILLDLPQQAREVVYRVIDKAGRESGEG